MQFQMQGQNSCRFRSWKLRLARADVKLTARFPGLNLVFSAPDLLLYNPGELREPSEADPVPGAGVFPGESYDVADTAFEITDIPAFCGVHGLCRVCRVDGIH